MEEGGWGGILTQFNEHSPDQLRGFFTGLAYQIGVLIASGSAYFEARMAHFMRYGRAMGLFAVVVLLLGALVASFGPEAHRTELGRRDKANSGSALLWLRGACAPRWAQT